MAANMIRTEQDNGRETFLKYVWNERERQTIEATMAQKMDAVNVRIQRTRGSTDPIVPNQHPLPLNEFLQLYNKAALFLTTLKEEATNRAALTALERMRAEIDRTREAQGLPRWWQVPERPEQADQEGRIAGANIEEYWRNQERILRHVQNNPPPPRETAQGHGPPSGDQDTPMQDIDGGTNGGPRTEPGISLEELGEALGDVEETVVGWRKQGFGKMVIVQIGSEMSPSYRMKAASEVGTFDEDEIPNIALPANKRCAMKENGQWKYKSKDIHRIRGIAWRIPQNLQYHQTALSILDPQNKTAKGDRFPATTIGVIWKDKQVTWESRTAFSRLWGTAQAPVKILKAAEIQEKEYEQYCRTQGIEGRLPPALLGHANDSSHQARPGASAQPSAAAQPTATSTQSSGQAQATNQQPLSQQPVSQQPVSQQPVSQQPVSQQPVGQQPVSQQPVSQQPVSQQPVSQQPVSQQPVSQQPVSQQPVSQQLFYQQPVGQQPLTQQLPGQTLSQPPWNQQQQVYYPQLTSQPTSQPPWSQQPQPNQQVYYPQQPTLATTDQVHGSRTTLQ
ncbi:MAG: hypothetical protein M1833_004265 [Piccolia ochrophora]|nr:MAG: hypothetical protein M1833_004265 [Piccolia ochrophora]